MGCNITRGDNAIMEQPFWLTQILTRTAALCRCSGAAWRPLEALRLVQAARTDSRVSDAQRRAHIPAPRTAVAALWC